jgi:hypothetical protein
VARSVTHFLQLPGYPVRSFLRAIAAYVGLVIAGPAGDPLK